MLIRYADIFYRQVDLDENGEVDGIGFRLEWIHFLDKDEDPVEKAMIPLESTGNDTEDDMNRRRYFDAAISRQPGEGSCIVAWLTSHSFGVAGVALLGGNCRAEELSPFICYYCQREFPGTNTDSAIFGVCGTEMAYNFLLLAIPGNPQMCKQRLRRLC